VKICILMGSADISGGSGVIFEHALYLQAIGVDLTVVPLEPKTSVASDWHPALGQLRFSTLEEIAGLRFDLAIATWWKTAYELWRVDAARYCYFVQSIETWFYPEEDIAVRTLADATYSLGLPTVTEANWIVSHLHKRFGTTAYLVPNGCNKAMFREDGPAESPRSNGRLRVLVEGAFGVRFKNVARTIALLRKSEADEIWLLTNSPIDSYPGVERVFSRVPLRQCPNVYRSCDVLVKLSYVEGMFGPPLEMFHCGGTAVVYDVTGFDEYIVHDRNAIVVSSGDEDAVIHSVNAMKRDPALLSRLKQGARSAAQAWPGWDDVGPRFHDAITKIAECEPEYPRERLTNVTRTLLKQYAQTQSALERSGDRTWPKRLRGMARRTVTGLGRRSTRLDRWLRVMHARLVEERWRGSTGRGFERAQASKSR
jgi:glycosyltransferase involved in cell wall biosynthesis